MAIFDRLKELCGRLLGGANGWVDSGEARPLANLNVRVGKCTSIGYYRDNNEDRFFVDDGQRLFIVADGMGGQAAGEQASQLAVDLVSEKLVVMPTGLSDPGEIRKSVSQAVVAANSAILAQGIADPAVQNMGTTIVVAVLQAGRGYVAHLGDSRAYLLRNQELHPITTDHSMAQALYEARTISKDEIRTHRYRHILWKYLGSKEAGEGPDLFEVDLVPGDRIVLATDGLTGVVDDPTLCGEILKRDDPQKCAEDLVQFALDKGSKDNVTVVVLYIDEEPKAE